MCVEARFLEGRGDGKERLLVVVLAKDLSLESVSRLGMAVSADQSNKGIQGNAWGHANTPRPWLSKVAQTHSSVPYHLLGRKVADVVLKLVHGQRRRLDHVDGVVHLEQRREADPEAEPLC